MCTRVHMNARVLYMVHECNNDKKKLTKIHRVPNVSHGFYASRRKNSPRWSCMRALASVVSTQLTLCKLEQDVTWAEQHKYGDAANVLIQFNMLHIGKKIA